MTIDKLKELSFDEFTTRPDTLFGMTFAVLSPEHPLIQEILSISSNSTEIQKYIDDAKKKSEFERMSLTKEKTGVDTGLFVINPVNGQKVSLWIADYVLINYEFIKTYILDKIIIIFISH